MKTEIVKNGNFRLQFLNYNEFFYNQSLFPYWKFDGMAGIVLSNGSSAFGTELPTNEQCLVVQQYYSGSNMKISQIVNLRSSGDYTLTFKNKHRQPQYSNLQKMYVTIDSSGTSGPSDPSGIILQEQDCTPIFNPSNPQWEKKSYKFKVSKPGDFNLRFTVNFPQGNQGDIDTSLFITDIDISKDSNIIRAPPPAQSVMSCDGFVDGYAKNLISSNAEQGIVENDKNSYTSVFSDIVTNTIHNPVSDYFNFNLRTK